MVYLFLNYYFNIVVIKAGASVSRGASLTLTARTEIPRITHRFASQGIEEGYCSALNLLFLVHSLAYTFTRPPHTIQPQSAEARREPYIDDRGLHRVDRVLGFSPVVRIGTTHPLTRRRPRFFLQSSEIGTPQTPSTTGECVPSSLVPGWGTHSLAG